MRAQHYLRTWVEVNSAAIRHNVSQIRRVLGEKCKLMAVVKSNAYGHGLVGAARILNEAEPSIRFGVDSFIEGLRLRREGFKNPILVLGSTLPGWYSDAAGQRISLTVSTFEALGAVSSLKEKPGIHLKIDTGMHRQGFLPEDIYRLSKVLKRLKVSPEGVYTHFAAAKDRMYPAETIEQFSKFQKSVRQLERAGFRQMIRHAAASAGTILFPEAHCDMVRVGMALWGCWPSQESRLNVLSGRFGLPKISLKPALSWKTRVSEIKKIKAGSLIGYDLTERVGRHSVIAVLPIGYWHGFDRGLSSIGWVLVHGKRAKVLGRVSMDMVVCDVTGIPKTRLGDTVVLLGRQGREEISAEDVARLIGTSPYEILTRINPLIERIYK